METTLLEGSIGYLVGANGIKHAFGTNIREVIRVLPGNVSYVNNEGKKKRRMFLVSGEAVTFLREEDLD